MKAAIFDSQDLFKEGVKSVLSSLPAFDDVVELTTDLTLSTQLEIHAPDLFIYEYLGSHDLNENDVTLLRKKFPKMKQLIISDDENVVEIKSRVLAGVNGFLTKRCSLEEIHDAVESIFMGKSFYCSRISDMMSSDSFEKISTLSRREIEVLQGIGKGLSSSQISDQLYVSIHTVNSHRKNIMKKLGFQSPAAMIAFAVKLANT